MKPIEKLARDICWAEFVGPQAGNTRARYWMSLPQETKDAYVVEASRIAFMVCKLSLSPLRLCPVAGKPLQYISLIRGR